MVQNTKVDPVVLDMILDSIQENKTGVNVLYDIICKGHDGQQSLMTRISVLERENNDKEDRIKELEGYQVQFKVEDRKTKLYIMYLLGAAVVAVITNTGTDRIKWLFELFK